MTETALGRRHRLASSLRALPAYAGPGRKTLVTRAPRRPLHLMPPWRLSFTLPDGMTLAPDYPTGLVCVRIVPIGRETWIEIEGRDRPFVFRQAMALMRTIAPWWHGSLWGRLIRLPEAGPTLSGPVRRGDDKAVELRLAGAVSTVTEGTGMRQLPLPMV